MIYALSIGFVVVVWVAIVYLNERHNLLSCDRFPTPALKWTAYAWLGLFMVLLAFLVTGSALAPIEAEQLKNLSFAGIFMMHGILVLFLVGWWALSGAPPLREFLQIRHEKPAEVVAIGVSTGVGGWAATLAMAALFALILRALGFLDNPPEPPATIGWMAGFAWWKKALIVLSAMTVEEFFFRSFLQKRIGLVASTVLFSLAHFTYGNPLLLVGITIISIIIGVAFWRTKNVLPGIIAHGVFDAIQLFVIVPIAFRVTGMGA